MTACWMLNEIIMTIKSFRRLVYWPLAAVFFAVGCRGTPSYHGEGEIKNTSYWADGVVYARQYTINLMQFNLSTNFQKDFEIGQLSSFRDARVVVGVSFNDQYSWYRFSELHSKGLEFAETYHWHNRDNVKSVFGFRVWDQSGVLLDQPPKLLRDYNWSGGTSQPERGEEIEITRLDKGIDVSKGSRLKLSVSYTGDSALTNQANLVVVWEWR